MLNADGGVRLVGGCEGKMCLKEEVQRVVSYLDFKQKSLKLKGKFYGSFCLKLHDVWKRDMANEKGAWINAEEDRDMWMVR